MYYFIAEGDGTDKPADGVPPLDDVSRVRAGSHSVALLDASLVNVLKGNRPPPNTPKYNIIFSDVI